ncbi:MAG TPA: thioredoxin domain-containing protein [Polyangiaceae bacterium]|nr:thioredoxin domain-containing protein [Polyangiaceae bacterium]
MQQSPSLDVSPGPSGGTILRVHGPKLAAGADPEAALAQVRRALFGLASVVPPEHAQAEFDGFSVHYAHPPGTPSLAEHPPADAMAVALELAQAVGELHDRGFAHGALDPRLMFAAPDGLRILGAGLHETSTAGGLSAGAICVDPNYVAPELSAGDAPSARGDVFALGRILLRVLGLPQGPLHAVATAAASDNPAARPSDAWALRDALRRARDAPALQSPSVEPERPLASPPNAESAAAAPSAGAAVAPRHDATDSERAAREEGAAPERPAPSPSPDARGESKHGSAWAILFMLGGGILLLLGFAGVFAFAFLRTTPPTVATAPASASAAAPVPTPLPPPGVGPVPAEPPDAAPPEPSEPEPSEPSEPEPSEPSEPEPSEPSEPEQSEPEQSEPEQSEPESSEPEPPLARKLGQGATPAPGGALSPLPAGADLPTLGPPNAAVTLIVFGDLACPHTRRSMDVLRKLRTAFPTDLRAVFRHRPLPQHANAESAARTAAGVHLDHGSEAFFRLLYALSATPGTGNRTEMRSALSAAHIPDSASWQSDARVTSRLQNDQRLAGLFGVRETPTFFMNGERFEGFHDYRALETAVKKERAAVRGLAAQGVAASALYAARVRKNMIGIGLEVPDRTCPKVGGQPARGATDPLVTIVEFSDFECRYCKKLAPALDQVLAKRGGDVRLVWRNFPLESHGHARAAASLALQAHKQLGDRKFWQAHDRLFDSQSDLGDPALSAIAKELGLDPRAALRAIKSDAHAATIRGDISEGTRVGVRGTPTLFVNGRSVPGSRSATQLLRIVDEEIDWARRLSRSGTPRHRIYAAVCGE